jgi:hypothetical protein
MMRRIGNRPWTPREDVILQELAATGKHAVAIAVEMNRSASGIRIRAKQIGITIAKVSRSKPTGRESEQ